jgi:uncharacterized protein (TIGR00730 family)
MKLCVFAGSGRGGRADFVDTASALGHELAARRVGLVYGGAQVGLMGAVAEAVLERGGHVIGVIPRALATREVAHPGLTDLRVVASMHERKQTMADLADGFISLPGGLGTLEETLEMLTWAQLGIHRKPCGLLNAAGYFDRLLDFLDHALAERFIRDEHRAMLLVDRTPAGLLDQFAGYTPPVVPKWMDWRQT